MINDDMTTSSKHPEITSEQVLNVIEVGIQHRLDNLPDEHEEVINQAIEHANTFRLLQTQHEEQLGPNAFLIARQIYARDAFPYSGLVNTLINGVDWQTIVETQVETNLQEFLNDPRYEELIEDVRGMLKRMVGKEESEYLIALQDLQMGLLDYGKKFQPSLRCIIAVRKVVEETFNKRRINKNVMEEELGQAGVWALHYLKIEINLQTKATLVSFGLISKEIALLRADQDNIKEELMTDRISKNDELLKLRRALKNLKNDVNIIQQDMNHERACRKEIEEELHVFKKEVKMEAQHDREIFESQHQQLEYHQQDILILQHNIEQQTREKDSISTPPTAWILMPKEIKEIKETTGKLMERLRILELAWYDEIPKSSTNNYNNGSDVVMISDFQECRPGSQ